MAEHYDLVVLGAGPGGYVAAIRAAQLGMNVALVEREKVGGVCLHKGCIPSKTLLRSAEVYDTVRRARDYGIMTENALLDMGKVQERKQQIVSQLHTGVQQLLKKHNVTVHEGTGRFLGASIFSPQTGTVSVEQGGGENVTLIPKHVIIATGSRPRGLPGLSVDGNKILNSDYALKLARLPDSMVIIGGGVIGIEWASMLSDFGLNVTVVEAEARVLPHEDEEISKEMTRLLKKRKVKLLTETKVQPDTVVIEEGVVRFQVQTGSNSSELKAEQVLLSVGRTANIDDIGLSNTDIKAPHGFVEVNEFMQTAESHIYAIGDVVGGYQLAHVASHEGIIAVEHMAGLSPVPLDARLVPRCTYSRPEVASLGLSEREASEQGFRTKIGKIPFRAMGKARVHGDVDGFVKIIADAKTEDVLGVHMIGPHATELISEAGLAGLLEATPWEISQAIHPHPTLAEAMGEAALAVEERAIQGG